MHTDSSPVAITLFFAVIALTLVITWWAARRSAGTSQLYAAGGQISATQNGLAIAGDFLSASLFLGGVGIFFGAGYDAVLYGYPAMFGLVILLGLIAGPLRRMGRFTFADVIAGQRSGKSTRAFAAVSGLIVTLLYLVVQMVGAGTLIELLFGIPYAGAVVIVGALMVCYVAFGGMLATTWVQIIKAGMLVVALVVMSLLALGKVGFNLDALYAGAARAHRLGADVLQPGGMGMAPIEAFSLALAVMLGVPALPHILMRFFTVPDAATARKSLMIGTSIIGLVYVLVFGVLAIAAAAFVTGNPAFVDAAGAPIGGSNMVAVHLASFLGGDLMFGVIAAIAFATMLAVVAGLTVSAASALSHDLYVGVFARGNPTDGEESGVFRVACLAVGAVAILLAIGLKGQNIAYLTGMIYAIAASACFPALLLSIYWPRLTTAGVVTGGLTGLGLSIGMIVMGPSVWVKVLHHSAAIVPLDQPAIITVPLAFLVTVAVSLLTAPSR